LIKENPEKTVFKGQAAGKSQIQDNKFEVDVIFYHEGPDKEIKVPVEQKKDEETGIIYYEFKTEFSGFPKISPDDERYGQPFFEFRITDKAGNKFESRKQSYAEFVAPGSSEIVSSNWVDIDAEKNLFKDTENKTNNPLPNSLSFKTNPKIDDHQRIILTVTCSIKNIRHLKWKGKKAKELTLVFRNGEEITTSDKDEYIDKGATAIETASTSKTLYLQISVICYRTSTSESIASESISDV